MVNADGAVDVRFSRSAIVVAVEALPGRLTQPALGDHAACSNGAAR